MIETTPMAVPVAGSAVERVAKAIANADGGYVDYTGAPGNYASDEEWWDDHWQWYLRGRGHGGMADQSSQAHWERLARAAIAAYQEANP